MSASVRAPAPRPRPPILRKLRRDTPSQKRLPWPKMVSMGSPPVGTFAAVEDGAALGLDVCPVAGRQAGDGSAQQGRRSLPTVSPRLSSVKDMSAAPAAPAALSPTPLHLRDR